MKADLYVSDARSPDVTSTSLIERVRARDEEAWRCLAELYGPLVYHWCRKLGLKEDDSADVLQEVFRSLVTHIGGFEKQDTPGSFRGWLWTITRNKVRDFHKTRAAKVDAVGGTDAQMLLMSIPDGEPDDAGDSAISATGSLMHRALHRVRTEMKDTTWLAFWRTTIDDVAPAAVAEELGISVESVWQAKSRVLRRVRALLE